MIRSRKSPIPMSTTTPPHAQRASFKDLRRMPKQSLTASGSHFDSGPVNAASAQDAAATAAAAAVSTLTPAEPPPPPRIDVESIDIPLPPVTVPVAKQKTTIADAPFPLLLGSAAGLRLQAASTMFSVDDESAADNASPLEQQQQQQQPGQLAPRHRGARASVTSRIFTIQPILEGTIFANAPAVPFERCQHYFHELHQWQPFLWFRQRGYFSYALLAFSAFMTITLLFFAICTSQWFHLLFTVPWAFFIICELTFADKRLLLVLLRSFDTWFLWVNLFIMLIVVVIAEFSKTDASPLLFSWAESLEHEQSATLISYCVVFLGSMYATCFDVIYKSPIGERVRVTMEVILIAVFVRILVLDKFYRPMLDAVPVYWLYETSTRALLVQAVQNMIIFFASHLFKYFSGGASSVLSMSVTLWPLPRARDDDDIAFAIALFGAPVLASEREVRAVTERYEAALDELATPTAERENGGGGDESQAQAESGNGNESDEQPATALIVADSLGAQDGGGDNGDRGDADKAVELGSRAIHPAAVAISAEDDAADTASLSAISAESIDAPPLLHAWTSGSIGNFASFKSSVRSTRGDDGSAFAADSSPASSSAPSPALTPLTRLNLTYRPLLPVDGRTLNACFRHPAYTVFFWLVCLFTVLMMAIPAWNPTTVGHFVVCMTVWTALIVIEYSQLDRWLLYHCVKSFEFLFLVAYLIGFVSIQLYSVLYQAAASPDSFARSYTEIALFNVAANYAFFFTNLFAFLTDAAPTRRRANKIFLFVCMVANVVRLLVFDYVSSNGNSYSFPRNLAIGGSDARQLLLGFLVPIALFEIRYIWNLVVNRMDLTLLRVSVLVADSTKVSKVNRIDSGSGSGSRSSSEGTALAADVSLSAGADPAPTGSA